MRRWLEQRWYQKKFDLWSVIFAPLEILLTWLVSLRRHFYTVGIIPSWQSPVPVVVVGNLTVGGTGKTPLVIWLANQLANKGYSPGVVSRGYGGDAQNIMPVSVDANPSIVGDEPLLIASNTSCPVWIGKNRPAVIRALLAENPHCNVIISDDGLQHCAMKRDFEIVVVDGLRRFGNGRILPFGPMREPAHRILSVDAVVVNDGVSDIASDEYAMKLKGTNFYDLHNPKHQVSADYFLGKSVHAIAGIGNPVRFFNSLSQLGINFEPHAFPDHHQFQMEDLQLPGADIILMTEKDAVKCSKFEVRGVWVLPVRAKLTGGLEKKVIKKIESFYGR